MHLDFPAGLVAKTVSFNAGDRLDLMDTRSHRAFKVHAVIKDPRLTEDQSLMPPKTWWG